MRLDQLKVRACEILRMIPDEELSKLAGKTKVDYYAKALKGERMFYMLVYALLCTDRLSQRKLESVFSCTPFKELFNFSVDMKVTHGSISSRLSKIDLSFFEQAYEEAFGGYLKITPADVFLVLLEDCPFEKLREMPPMVLVQLMRKKWNKFYEIQKQQDTSGEAIPAKLALL